MSECDFRQDCFDHYVYLESRVLQTRSELYNFSILRLSTYVPTFLAFTQHSCLCHSLDSYAKPTTKIFRVKLCALHYDELLLAYAV